jgi:type II secretory pathway component GspD/PulD (secretin)
MGKLASVVALSILSLPALASMPLKAEDNGHALSGERDRLYTVKAKGRTMHDLLSEVENNGGPKAHYDKGFGKITLRLQEQFTADDWRELIQQLLMGYNYYMVIDSKVSRIKDVFIVDRTPGDITVKEESAAITTASDESSICANSRGGPFGHRGPQSIMRQQLCEGKPPSSR